MTYQLESLDLVNANALYVTGNYPGMCNYIADTIETHNATSQVDTGIVSWLRKAAKINSNDGSWFSEYVRNQTDNAAADAGHPITNQDFQDASDEIAARINFLINSESGKVLSAVQVIEIEVQQVVVNRLGLDDDDWAGTLLSYKFFGFDAVHAFVQNDNEYWDQVFRTGFVGFGTTVKVIDNWLVEVLNKFRIANFSCSPLVIDLDSDGIELISLSNAATYWDIDEDGFAEKTGWISSDDGLLAIDKNGNGIIDNHDELFGSMTTDGFSQLTPYDSNSDGVINANGAQYSDLLIWQDLNSNGYSEEGELQHLNDWDIVSIDLNGVSQVSYEIAGHEVSHESTVTYADASIADIVDVWLEFDDQNTVFAEPFSLDVYSLLLPTERGYGNMATLHIAMSLDNTGTGNLLDLVSNLNDTSFADLFDETNGIRDTIWDIMLRWAGVDGVSESARGAER